MIDQSIKNLDKKEIAKEINDIVEKRDKLVEELVEKQTEITAKGEPWLPTPGMIFFIKGSAFRVTKAFNRNRFAIRFEGTLDAKQDQIKRTDISKK